MNKFLFAGIALAAVAAGPALAADLPVRQAPPVYAPPPVIAYYNWTGCYLGLNGGYGWRQNHTIDAVISNGNTFTDAGTLGVSGGFGGGQVGCNYQAGAAVFGIETDFQGSGMSKSVGPTTIVAGGATGTFSASDKVKWFGTLRGRVGYAADRVLLYVTGGLAYANNSFEFTGVDAGGNSFTFDNSTTKTGYVLGAGIEWAVAGSWTVKAEYQYLNFGSVGPFTVPVLDAGGAPNGVSVTTSSHKADFQTIRIGFNYLFNAAPAPVPVYGK
jgi:outer membrane immunogenic protein